jgi:hypothetical protein
MNQHYYSVWSIFHCWILTLVTASSATEQLNIIKKERNVQLGRTAFMLTTARHNYLKLQIL